MNYGRRNTLIWSQIKAETQHFSTENDAIKGMLSSHGLDAQSELSILSLPTSEDCGDKASSAKIDSVESQRRSDGEIALESYLGEIEDSRAIQCRMLLLEDIEAYRSVTGIVHFHLPHQMVTDVLKHYS